ncbi:hypothetical protein [Bacillus sp. JAS24-2]|nr:hypothetical protein [Bacillus sp. JAS24-2]
MGKETLLENNLRKISTLFVGKLMLSFIATKGGYIEWEISKIATDI